MNPARIGGHNVSDDAPLPDDLEHAIAELDDDDAVDYERDDRQPAGWLRFYVECAECNVPMAHTTTESIGDSVPVGDASLKRSRTEIRAACPSCHRVVSHLQLVRLTGDIEDVPNAPDAAFNWDYDPPTPEPESND